MDKDNLPWYYISLTNEENICSDSIGLAGWRIGPQLILRKI
jgi:hypothetical protein